MARVATHNVVDNYVGELAATIAIDALSLIIVRSGNASPAAPFYLDIGSEILRCSSIVVDTPSAGRDTLTVTRAQCGTTAAAHNAGATVAQRAYAQQVTELQNKIAALELLMADVLGGGSGVQQTASATNLKVVATGTPGMTVIVDPGSGVVSGQPVALASAYTTAAFSAPVGNPRIDLVEITQSGTITVKTGTPAGSPSAPAVDANCLALATIYHRPAETSIKNADDSTNGYILDARVFL